jgi:hypothetical protein
VRRETIYLFNGVLLEKDGEPAMRIPRLFQSVSEAQAWIDSQEWDLEVVKGVRKGDVLLSPSEIQGLQNFRA